MLTGNLPFHSIPQDFSVVLAVKSGKRPPKPSGVWIGNTLWDLIERCWRQQREQRPSAKETVEELQVLSNVALRNNTQCDWDTIFMGQFRSNLHNHPFCMPQRDAVLPDVQSFVDEQTLFVDGEIQRSETFITNSLYQVHPALASPPIATHKMVGNVREIGMGTVRQIMRPNRLDNQVPACHLQDFQSVPKKLTTVGANLQVSIMP